MLTDAQIKQAKSTQKLSVSENPSTVSHFIAFNPENKQLQHKDLRQAISESIQTKALSSQPLKGLFQRDVQYVTAQNQQQHRFDKKRHNTHLNRQAIIATSKACMKKMVKY